MNGEKEWCLCFLLWVMILHYVYKYEYRNIIALSSQIKRTNCKNIRE